MMRAQYLSPGLLFAIALCLSGTTRATDAPNQQNENFETLSTLSLEDLMDVEVVSATGSSGRLGSSPVPISVITAREIADSGLDNIPDILARLPEIDVLRIGRSQSEVSIRGKGTNFSRRLLVLIDGRPEYNELLGTTFWQALPINVDDIQRIEVVRGPASALFGANAFAGVINIISKPVDSGASGGRMRMQGGTRNNRYTSAAYRVVGEQLSFGIRAGAQYGNSKRSETAFAGFNRVPSSSNFNADKTSLAMRRATAGLLYRPDDSWLLQLDAGATDGFMELIFQPGLPRSDWNVDSHFGRALARYQLDQDDSMEVSAYFNDFDYATPLVPATADVIALAINDGRHFFPSLDNPVLFSGEVQSMDIGFKYAGARSSGALSWVLGAEYRDVTTQGGLAQDKTRNTRSLYANTTWRFFDDFQLALGGLVSDDSITDVDFGWTTSLSWFPSSKQSLRFSWRRAFRSPDLFELFGAVDVNVPGQNQRVQFRGNADLQLEKIRSWDLSYHHQLTDALDFEAEIYFEDYTALIGNPDSGLLDNIIFDPATNIFTTTTSFRNLTNASGRGFLAKMNWIPTDHLRLYLNYSYNDPLGLNELSGETFFTPQSKVNIGGHWRMAQGFSLDLSAHYVGKTDADEFRRGNVSPDGPNFSRDRQQRYSYLDLKLAWRPPTHPELEVFLMGNNLYDDQHVEYFEFDSVLNAAGEGFGSEFFGGISWTF